MMRVRSVVGGLLLCALLASCSTGGVTDIDANHATLHGSILTGDAPASYVFQYARMTEALGTEAGWVTARKTIPAAAGETPVSETLDGLTAKYEASGGGDGFFVYRLCVRVRGATTDSCLNVREFVIPGGEYRTAVFNDPGESTFFTVPPGVTQLYISAWGAQGGAGLPAIFGFAPGGVVLPTIAGGKGAFTDTLVNVTPGQLLAVRVGSAGGSAVPQLDGEGPLGPFAAGQGAGGKGGTNGLVHGGDGGDGSGQGPASIDGGGGGGGAPSQVDLFGGSTTLAVAGGGGGTGAGVYAARQGDGPAVDTVGGDGGLFGRDGVANAENGAGRGAGRGAVGTGGAPGGATGGGQNGGGGGTDTSKQTNVGPFGSSLIWGRGGGGGGGGYFGGGGGGSGSFDYNVFASRSLEVSPSGGGGGSSYAGPDGYGFVTRGVRTGDGLVTVSWLPEGATPSSTAAGAKAAVLAAKADR